MRHIWKGLFALAALVAAFASPRPAHAAVAYPGIYVVIDPYNPTQQAMLKTAAQTSCAQNQVTVTTPFCGAVSGVMLRMAWCNFQLYHVNTAQGLPNPGCHYVLGYSGVAGSRGVQLPATDLTSPCNGVFDTCAGQTRSVLGVSLHAIGQINTIRANAGLPPLQLSLGMFAGIGTPQGVLDSVGYVDVPHGSANNDPAMEQCYRLPMLWRPQFLHLYDQAVDQMLSYVQTQLPNGANIAILKPGAISAVDLEVEMTGNPQFAAAPADPGPGTAGPAMACPTRGASAQVWLDAYNANPIANFTFAQATEGAFGHVIGHMVGALANAGMPGTLISIATNNGEVFPYISCGASGASPCQVDGSSKWSTYYLEHDVADLWNGGTSYLMAQVAYRATRNDTFSLPPLQIAMNSTGLSPQTITSAAQISCNLNNTVPVLAPTFNLGGTQQTVVGPGTVVGWQTQVLQGGECSSNQYMQALNNGIADGGQFIEVEIDAAFNNISQCSPYLTAALNQLLAGVAPPTCAYP